LFEKAASALTRQKRCLFRRRLQEQNAANQTLKKHSLSFQQAVLYATQPY
jgi:hypothetical protein